MLRTGVNTWVMSSAERAAQTKNDGGSVRQARIAGDQPRLCHTQSTSYSCTDSAEKSDKKYCARQNPPSLVFHGKMYFCPRHYAHRGRRGKRMLTTSHIVAVEIDVVTLRPPMPDRSDAICCTAGLLQG